MQITSKDLNQTVWVKPDEIAKNRKWYKIDATGLTLWRLAVLIAKQLTGKTKAYYNDFWDAGDFVIVENADKIAVTGNKLAAKLYRTHSGYKGHLKEVSLETVLAKHPTRVIEHAVRGMLPKNRLRAPRMKRLKAIVGTTNKYDHLSPELLKLNG